MEASDRREFKVVFEGAALGEEAASRIESAIRDAVLREIAELDLPQPMEEQPLGGIGGGMAGLHLVSRPSS